VRFTPSAPCGWWLIPDIDSNTQAYTDQVAAIKDAIEKYGTDHIEGVSNSRLTCDRYA